MAILEMRAQQPFQDDMHFVNEIHQGVSLGNPSGMQRLGGRNEVVLFYQHTSKNAFAQWLARQWQPAHDPTIQDYDRYVQILRRPFNQRDSLSASSLLCLRK